MNLKKFESRKIMLIWLAYVGFFCIGISFVWLVNLNWGPTVRTTLFSVLLGGMTTVLVAVLSGAKNQLNIDDKFSSHFFFNKQSRLPEQIFADSNSPGFIALIWWQNKKPSYDSLPHTPIAASRFIGEVLQEKILWDLKSMGLESVSITSGVKGSSVTTSAGVMKRPSDTKRLPLKSIMMLNSNRFLEEEISRTSDESTDYSGVPVPNGTTITLKFDEPNQQYQVVLGKEFYFHITFVLGPMAIPGAYEDSDPTILIPYALTITANFDSLSASGSKAAEYREWASWIINDFKSNWSKYR